MCCVFTLGRARSCVYGAQEESTGRVVTLMSNDAQKLQDAMMAIHALWGSPLYIVAVLVLLWQQVRSKGWGGWEVAFERAQEGGEGDALAAGVVGGRSEGAEEEGTGRYAALGPVGFGLDASERPGVAVRKRRASAEAAWWANSLPQVGWATLVGLAVMLLLAPLTGTLAAKLGRLRRDILQWTDKRVGYMNEVISGILMIKVRSRSRCTNRALRAGRLGGGKEAERVCGQRVCLDVERAPLRLVRCCLVAPPLRTARCAWPRGVKRASSVARALLCLPLRLCAVLRVGGALHGQGAGRTAPGGAHPAQDGGLAGRLWHAALQRARAGGHLLLRRLDHRRQQAHARRGVSASAGERSRGLLPAPRARRACFASPLLGRRVGGVAAYNVRLIPTCEPMQLHDCMPLLP